jgi:hypothetical protein
MYSYPAKCMLTYLIFSLINVTTGCPTCNTFISTRLKDVGHSRKSLYVSWTTLQYSHIVLITAQRLSSLWHSCSQYLAKEVVPRSEITNFEPNKNTFITRSSIDERKGATSLKSPFITQLSIHSLLNWLFLSSQ